MDNFGIIYILSNPSMPGIVKIGFTYRESIEVRMRELYSTGVPVPFECECAYKVENCELLERALHKAFNPYRVNQNREFFNIEPYQAEAIIQLFNKEEITNQVNKELSSEHINKERVSSKCIKTKRPKFTFSALGIKRGDIITFVKDPDITVEVYSDREVLYNNKIRSLTPITCELLNQTITLPTIYWKFEGQKLRDIYNDIYPCE